MVKFLLKSLQSLFLGSFLILAIAGLNSVNAEDRYSVATGNWNTTATWSATSGGSAGASVPVAGDNVSIEGGYTVTVNANTGALTLLSIASGSQLTTTSAFTVSATTITVNGTYVNGSTGIITGTMTVNGTYKHNFTAVAGTIPTATWATGSTCEIIGYTTANNIVMVGMNQSFYHFTWNNPSQKGDISGLGTPGTTMNINGNFSFLSSGTGNKEFKLIDCSTCTVNIQGDLIFNATAKTNKFDLSKSGTGSTINIYGDWKHSSGTLKANSAVNVVFKKSGTQIFDRDNTNTNALDDNTVNINFIVNSGATLQMAAATVVSGTAFTLASGATLGITSPDGITAAVGTATGNIRTTTTRSFSTEANYIYNGTADQNTGTGLPATVSNLTFNNSGKTVTFNTARIITNNFSITSGTKANLAAGLSHTAGTLTLGGSGTAAGSWGSTSSSATHEKDTYFAATTGIVNVSVGSCTNPSVPGVTPANNTYTYDGQAKTAIATVGTGEIIDWYTASTGNTATVAPTGTNFGTYSAYAEARNTTTDCVSASRSEVILTIGKADAVIVVNPYDVTYDANPHTSTGTATGVSSESLTGLDLSATTHTSAGDYTGYAWTFTDVTGNYNDDSGTVDNNIKKKPITVSVDVGQSKYCGQIDPDFTYTLSEPLLPDNSFTGGLSRITLDESVGIYAYTDGDLSAGMNYSLTLNETNNTFQIKSITIDASASGTPVQIGTSANLSATVSPGVGGVSVIFVVTNQAGVPVFTSEPDVTNSSGIATVLTEEVFDTIGVFTVTATAGSGCASSIAYIPVYDPTLNQLTGGGWIDSPQGSFAEDPAQTGKANFGFVFESISVSNSKKGPPSPVAGNGEFQFNAGSLNFKSTLPEAGKLVIANNTGEYQGDGSLNGSTGYTFILTAVDGDLKRGTDPDMFRIQIWGANGVIYDNGLNSNGKSGGTTALGGGAILILETQGKNRREIDPEFIEVAWNTPIASVEKQISEFGGKWFEGRKINMTIDPEAYNPLIPGLYELKVGIAENEWIELADQITVNVLVSAKPKALDIMFSNETIAMNTEKGTLIGILSTKDPIDAIHSYRIESSQVKVEGDRVIWIGEGAVPKVVSFVVFSMDRAGQEISKEIVMFRELDPNTVMLYPNPASKETNIQIGINEESKVEIRIFDSVGRLVFEETSIVNQSFTQRVNLEGLSSGMYTVQVQINYQVITKRLIKK